MREHDRVLSDADVVADWYQNVFAPAVAPDVRARVAKTYRILPDADLFLLLHERRRDEFPSRGCPRLAETPASLAEPERRGLVSLLHGR